MPAIITMDLDRPQYDLLSAVLDDWSEIQIYNVENWEDRAPEDREMDKYDLACAETLAEQLPAKPGIAVFSGIEAIDCLDDLIQWLLRFTGGITGEWNRDDLAFNYQSTPETAAKLVAAYDRHFEEAE